MVMLFAWASGRGDSGLLLQAILLVGLVKGAVSAGEVFLGVMQQRERMDLVARSWAYRSVASVGAFALGSSQGGLEGGLAAWAASSLLILLTHDIRAVARLEGGSAWRQLGIRLDRSTLHSLLRLASPLAIAAFLSSLLVSLPVLALEKFASIETTGLYGAVAYLAIMTRQALEAIGKATIPRMARAYVDRQLGAFRRILAGNAALVALMSAATIIVAAVGEEFYVGTIFSLSIPESGTAFVALMIAAAIGNFAQVAILGLAATRAFRFSAIVIGASVVMLAVLCWIWVPKYSLNGVAGAAAAAGFFRLVIASIGVRSRLLQRSAAPAPTIVRTR
jgi:O-antigen/teichoic acid export membrane protein